MPKDIHFRSEEPENIVLMFPYLFMKNNIFLLVAGIINLFSDYNTKIYHQTKAY